MITVHIIAPIEDGTVWRVQSTVDNNVWYSVSFPCTKYACCDCEWSIRRNFCKHQIAILLTFGISADTIVEFCGT